MQHVYTYTGVNALQATVFKSTCCLGFAKH